MKPDKDHYKEFSDRFKDMSDKGLLDAFNREVGNMGWVGARASYLVALQDEFDNRGYDYSAIGDKLGFSIKNRIKLIGKKIVIVEVPKRLK